jgi:hypothetical protein
MDHLAKENMEPDHLEENIFKRINIPRSLNSIPIEKVEKEIFGQPSPYHQVITGLVEK